MIIFNLESSFFMILPKGHKSVDGFEVFNGYKLQKLIQIPKEFIIPNIKRPIYQIDEETDLERK